MPIIYIYRYLLIGIDIHLTLATIKLEAESSAIGQTEAEGLAPLRSLAAVFDAMAKGEAQAMATLHDERLRGLCGLEGRCGLHATVVIELAGLGVGHIVEIGMVLVTMALRRRNDGTFTL